MSEDEQFTQETWERAEECPNSTSWCVSLGGRGFTSHCTEWFAYRAEAWSAAATFTRAWPKEIAEIEEEIAMVNRFILYRNNAIESGYEPVAQIITEMIADNEVFKRILTRLTTALAAKRMGMKGAK